MIRPPNRLREREAPLHRTHALTPVAASAVHRVDAALLLLVISHQYPLFQPLGRNAGRPCRSLEQAKYGNLAGMSAPGTWVARPRLLVRRSAQSP